MKIETVIDKDLQQVYTVGNIFPESDVVIDEIDLVESYAGKGLHNDKTEFEVVISGEGMEIKEIYSAGLKLIYKDESQLNG